MRLGKIHNNSFIGFTKADLIGEYKLYIFWFFPFLVKNRKICGMLESSIFGRQISIGKTKWEIESDDDYGYYISSGDSKLHIVREGKESRYSLIEKYDYEKHYSSFSVNYKDLRTVKEISIDCSSPDKYELSILSGALLWKWYEDLDNQGSS